MPFEGLISLVLIGFGLLIILFSKKKTGVAVSPVFISKREYPAAILFTIIIPVVDLGFKLRRGLRGEEELLRRYILYLAIIFTLISILVGLIMEYRHRKFTRFEFFSPIPMDVEAIIENVYRAYHITFEKSQYIGWIRDGIKYTSPQLPQQLLLFFEVTDVTNYKLVMSNYRMSEGSGLVEVLEESIARSLDGVAQERYRVINRNNYIFASILIFYGLSLLGMVVFRRLS